MAENSAFAVIQSTRESALSLLTVVQTVPHLERSSLRQELEETIFLFDRIQQHSETISTSKDSATIVDVIKHIGEYCLRVEERIEEAHCADFFDWITFEVDKRNIPEIVKLLQMCKASAFVGVVGQAMSVNGPALMESCTNCL